MRVKCKFWNLGDLRRFRVRKFILDHSGHRLYNIYIESGKGKQMTPEQLQAWARQLYREVDEQLDCDQVTEELEQRAKIDSCEDLDKPV